MLFLFGFQSLDISEHQFGVQAEWNNIQPIETWEEVLVARDNMKELGKWLQREFQEIHDHMCYDNSARQRDLSQDDEAMQPLLPASQERYALLSASVEEMKQVMITKDDVEQMATKEDAEKIQANMGAMATKEDLEKIQASMDEMKRMMQQMEDLLKAKN